MILPHTTPRPFGSTARSRTLVEAWSYCRAGVYESLRTRSLTPSFTGWGRATRSFCLGMPLHVARTKTSAWCKSGQHVFRGHRFPR